MWIYNYNSLELYHHGVKGQKWGIRRYQNEDGSYTAQGRGRYNSAVRDARSNKKAAQSEYDKAVKEANKYSVRHLISKHTNKDTKNEMSRLWDEASKKGELSRQADKNYSAAKKARKQELKREQSDWKNARKDFNSTRSFGRHAVNLLVNGPVGSYTYNSLRTAGATQLQAEAAVLVSKAIAGPLGNMAVAYAAGSYYKDRHN